jgi:hypothetical protein
MTHTGRGGSPSKMNSMTGRSKNFKSERGMSDDGRSPHAKLAVGFAGDETNASGLNLQ